MVSCRLDFGVVASASGFLYIEAETYFKLTMRLPLPAKHLYCQSLYSFSYRTRSGRFPIAGFFRGGVYAPVGQDIFTIYGDMLLKPAIRKIR
jgi:hypothetical protein